MSRIVIIGGGFSGLSALKVFLRTKSNNEFILIDRKKTFDFLPALPDIIGERFKPESLNISLYDFCRKNKIQFINKEVEDVDFKSKNLNCGSQILSYDYLLLSSGTQANFYGNEVIRKNSYQLDSVDNAKNILEAVNSNIYSTYIIVGGGYTGVEVATNLKRYSLRHKKEIRVIIIEKTHRLLVSLPDWVVGYVQKNILNLGIEVFLDNSVAEVAKSSVSLSSGQRFESTLLIWTAGVKTSDYIFKIDSEKTSQGRLKVDEYLRINRECFVAGDAAAFFKNDIPIRMAVQFSLAEGRLAAHNILNTINQKKLIPYQPKDLGYIIPMANNKSCGLILGVRVKGFLASFFHYFMCVYRSQGLKNRWSLIINLFKGGVS
ncbi:MAG: FAD-dependent oxidoreductase [Candidatus Omnitrophica bacterium]|jgi:NADH dehydrogenase|nr:FAD-dependent oxidoreductase [Candidatus Omnitrophota bacterium]